MHAVVVTDMRLFYVRAGPMGPTGGVTRELSLGDGMRIFQDGEESLRDWRLFFELLGTFQGSLITLTHPDLLGLGFDISGMGEAMG